MICRDIQKMLGSYLEGELSTKEDKGIREHLAICPLCSREAELYQKSWELLGNWKPVQPVPGYMSRFWTKVAQETPWHKKFLRGLKNFWTNQSVVVSLSTLCVFVAVGPIVYVNFYRPPQEIAKMSPEEIEMAANMDFVQYVDALESIETSGEANNAPQQQTQEVSDS